MRVSLVLLLALAATAVVADNLAADQEAEGFVSIPFYGNWCGPGYPADGQNPPIKDALDGACRSHDRCYGTAGYFDCKCNAELLKTVPRMPNPCRSSSKAIENCPARYRDIVNIFRNLPCMCRNSQVTMSFMGFSKTFDVDAFVVLKPSQCAAFRNTAPAAFVELEEELEQEAMSPSLAENHRFKGNSMSLTTSKPRPAPPLPKRKGPKPKLAPLPAAEKKKIVDGVKKYVANNVVVTAAARNICEGKGLIRPDMKDKSLFIFQLKEGSAGEKDPAVVTAVETYAAEVKAQFQNPKIKPIVDAKECPKR